MVIGTEVVAEVASGALADSVRVIGRWCIGDRHCCSYICMAQLVSLAPTVSGSSAKKEVITDQLLQFHIPKSHSILDDKVMCWDCGSLESVVGLKIEIRKVGRSNTAIDERSWFAVAGTSCRWIQADMMSLDSNHGRKFGQVLIKDLSVRCFDGRNLNVLDMVVLANANSVSVV